MPSTQDFHEDDDIIGDLHLTVELRHTASDGQDRCVPVEIAQLDPAILGIGLGKMTLQHIDDSSSDRSPIHLIIQLNDDGMIELRCVDRRHLADADVQTFDRTRNEFILARIPEDSCRPIAVYGPDD